MHTKVLNWDTLPEVIEDTHGFILLIKPHIWKNKGADTWGITNKGADTWGITKFKRTRNAVCAFMVS